ncbi:mechanosensitive ion channel [Shewanella sp. WXL01]|uniref:mechanosensitive ion channel family protein n=1 Tax=Shewanella sp. WXL01 TaxID=2709721 RepID=UPI0014385AC9|nr:mechanosensitive ion channel domain-containing protein [Shewanella sp. WXL01]NKF49180.1 mechanosensitive ion channel [Shewanella sp. WXL01]
MSSKRLAHVLLLSFTFIACLTQPGYASDINLKKVSDAEKRSEEIAESQLSLGLTRPGETPLSTMIAITEAAEVGDWQTAAEYADLRFLPKSMSAEKGPEYMRKLGILWSKQQILDLSQISDSPTGHANDKLPSYRDLIGTLETQQGPVPVYLQHVPDGKSGKVWKISNATIAKIPELWSEFGYHPYAEKLSLMLPEFYLMHMENWQVIVFFSALFLGWFASGLVSYVAKRIAQRFEQKISGLMQFCGRSLRWFIYLSFLQHLALSLGLSVRARVWFDNSTLLYIANTILALGIIELYCNYKSKQLHAQDKGYSVALLRPLVAIIKIIVVIIISLMWLQSSGYNMATVLTGLGVGSLAIALAAQKPLENIFGALTLYAAKPIKPGDFCRFDKTLGVVEEIGLRSTRIRKLDRTVVHIPNSIFSSKELENFSVIDRRRYKHDLRISLNTSKQQLQLLLMELRKLLLSHPRVLAEAQRARFIGIERDAFVVNVNAYIDTGDINEYFAIAEDLNFHILSMLNQLDVHIAPIGQNVVLQRADSANLEVQRQAEQLVQEMIEDNQLPFPNYTEEERNAFKGSIEYPPTGSITKPKDVVRFSKEDEETEIRS